MSTRKPVNWKAAADLRVIGKAVPLKSLPGYWIKPRRYSVTGDAEVQAAEIRALAQVKEDALRGVAAAAQGEGEITDEAKRELMVKVLEHVNADMVGSLEKKRAMLRYGVHAHNFEGEAIGPTDEWVDEVFERAEIADEILKIVEEKNSPLESKTSPTSATSPSGDLKEQNSEAGASSSPTEPTPPNS